MKPSFHQRFIAFIREYELFTERDKLLLAVSGGVDSVVLAHALKQLGFSFGIIHCNFKLRGEDSEADERFVIDLAKNLEVSIYLKSFDTKLYAEEHKISIQMAARDLRYSWFEEMRVSQGYRYILTAHQQNDVAETVLLNLSKGAVLNGLHGILPKKNNIIRPLLWATKDEIVTYSEAERIQYREDNSNREDKYQRNLIRHKVIPELQKINLDLIENIFQTSLLRNEIGIWFNKYCENIKGKLFQKNKEFIFISKIDLQKEQINSAILYELIKEYGFTPSQAKNLFRSLNNTESAEFLSESYRLIKDREGITISYIKEDELIELLISNIGEYRYKNILCSFSILNQIPELDELKQTNSAFLDYNKLQFPLKIRVWQEGDYFIPFGMKGKKLISDYLTDIKLGKIQKENQTVLISGEDICWVVGLRVDDRYKIGEGVKKVLKVDVSIS